MTEAVIESPAGAPAAPAAPVAPAAAAPAAPAEPSALAKPVPLHERIPEKFHVKKGEELDAEASMAKVLEGYQALEKRVGSGDIPPKSAEEYTVTPPEELKEALKDFKLSPEFLKGAHDKGITQGQLDYMLTHYFKEAPALMQGGLNSSVEATISSLDKAWGAEYDKHLGAAAKAFEAYADPADKGRFDDIMKDPSLAYRILAKIGPELGEAGAPPRNAEGSSEESVQALLTDPVLQNPKHPEYSAKRAKVDAYYAKKYGTAPAN
jgi:hypothetical protein